MSKPIAMYALFFAWLYEVCLSLLHTMATPHLQVKVLHATYYNAYILVTCCSYWLNYSLGIQGHRKITFSFKVQLITMKDIHLKLGVHIHWLPLSVFFFQSLFIQEWMLYFKVTKFWIGQIFKSNLSSRISTFSPLLERVQLSYMSIVIKLLWF